MQNAPGNARRNSFKAFHTVVRYGRFRIRIKFTIAEIRSDCNGILKIRPENMKSVLHGRTLFIGINE